MQITLKTKKDKYLLIALSNQYVLRKYKRKDEAEEIEQIEENEVDGLKDNKIFSRSYYFGKLEQVVKHLAEYELSQQDLTTLNETYQFMVNFAKSIQEQFDSEFKRLAARG